MTKEKLTIDYSGSGIRSLKTLSVFSFILVLGGGIILLMYSIYLFSSYRSSDNALGTQLLPLSFFMILSGLALGVICRALSTIAENSLYQKTKLKHELERDYIFAERDYMHEEKQKIWIIEVSLHKTNLLE